MAVTPSTMLDLGTRAPGFARKSHAGGDACLPLTRSPNASYVYGRDRVTPVVAFGSKYLVPVGIFSPQFVETVADMDEAFVTLIRTG